MWYFIALLPKDPVSEYHRSLVRDLAMRFGLKISKGFFPTHWTIKAPFETADVSEVKNVLEKFATTHQSGQFTIHGFGHFDKSVIFMNVLLTEQSGILVRELQSNLRQVPDLSWGKYEPLKNFHITVAKNFPDGKFDLIWAHINKRQSPYFELPLDHIALLREENGEWIVDSIYPLN